MKYLRGQIPVVVAIIGAIGMIGTSAITGWFSASGKVAQIDKEVSVIAERENNHYAEIQKQLTEISRKLDSAPWAQNKTVAR